MPRVHQAVFSEKLPAGSFQGMLLPKHSNGNTAYKTAVGYFFNSVLQTHKTRTSKVEQPPSTAASSRVSVKLESSEEERMDKEKVKTERMKTPSGWKCRSCNTPFTEREDYIAHMSQEHGKVWKPSAGKVLQVKL